MLVRRWLRASGALFAVGLLTACAPTPARMVRQIPWHGQGVWLKADTHVHTDFSDGGYLPDQIVAKAASFGCDVVALTDHSDSNLDAATAQHFAAINAARQVHPGVIVLTGVEWNVPPWGGDQHATVLVPPAVERRLADFKTRFDDYKRPTHEGELATEALEWLQANGSVEDVLPVITWEHPSRQALEGEDHVAVMQRWRKINDLVVGFAGAPGHQGMLPTGDYPSDTPTLDRWDPVVARTGGAWDTLLASGLDVWGANAPSDFHNDVNAFMDHWPCQFAETWVYAPDRTAEGVLRALRAGSVFASHGRGVRNVTLEVTADGLSRPAGAGETLMVGSERNVLVNLRFELAPDAWPDDRPNRIDRVELIAIDGGGARVVAEGAPATPVALTHTLAVPDGGVVLRARGYRDLSNGQRLAFYTNPVRITTN